MFVRFRQSARRLQLSLVETRRDGSKVRHEHIAPPFERLPLKFRPAQVPRFPRAAAGLSTDLEG